MYLKEVPNELEAFSFAIPKASLFHLPFTSPYRRLSALLEGICLPYSGIIRQADVFLPCGTEVFKRPESWICARKAAADSWGLYTTSLPLNRCSLCPLFLKQWFWKAPPGKFLLDVLHLLYSLQADAVELRFFPIHSAVFFLVTLTQGLKRHTLDILRALLFCLPRTKSFGKSAGLFVTFSDQSKGTLFPLKGCMDYKVHGRFLYINLTISSLLRSRCPNHAPACIELLNIMLGW